VIAAEFVIDCDVAVTAEVDVLDSVLEHQVSPPHLVGALLDGGDVAPLHGDPGLPAASMASMMVSWPALRLPVTALCASCRRGRGHRVILFCSIMP
jgi:hypothetical protein